jgi:uncharacterized phage protein (TIGR01671 family)
MNREHKYRAYINNPIHGTGIFKVKSINFYPLVVTVIIPNGKYIDDIELSDEVQFFEDEVKLLEYTGLKDKNKKEIYENDTVSLTGCRYNTAKIVWFDGKFELRINNNEVSWFLTESTIWKHKIEVVGNAYENEQLSKEV